MLKAYTVFFIQSCASKLSAGSCLYDPCVRSFVYREEIRPRQCVHTVCIRGVTPVVGLRCDVGGLERLPVKTGLSGAGA